QGIEILTGIKAGARNPNSTPEERSDSARAASGRFQENGTFARNAIGTFEDGSIFARADDRLRIMAKTLSDYE
ncbi:MAG: hypothetical protein WBE47_00690, partial [Candidatus Acidiferrales bacterium]